MIFDGYAQLGGRHGEAARGLERELQESTLLGPNESLSLLEELRQRIVALHERETKAAEHLRSAAA